MKPWVAERWCSLWLEMDWNILFFLKRREVSASKAALVRVRSSQPEPEPSKFELELELVTV